MQQVLWHNRTAPPLMNQKNGGLGMQKPHLLKCFYEDITTHVRKNGFREAEIMPPAEIAIEPLQMAGLRFQIQLLLQRGAELQPTVLG